MLSEDEQRAAAAIHQDLRDRLDDLKANRTLTRDARDRYRAQAVLSAREQLDAIRAESDAQHSDNQELAYHAAFGIFGDDSADDRAYRDRLATNTPTADEANKMMALAIARGDLVTQRGLAELAWNNRHNPDGYWVNVLNKWGDSDGANHEQIMALVNLEPASKVDKFQDKLYTQVVQPEDLPGSLETLAQEPEEANPWISNGPSPMGARFG